MKNLIHKLNRFIKVTISLGLMTPNEMEQKSVEMQALLEVAGIDIDDPNTPDLSNYIQLGGGREEVMARGER